MFLHHENSPYLSHIETNSESNNNRIDGYNNIEDDDVEPYFVLGESVMNWPFFSQLTLLDQPEQDNIIEENAPESPNTSINKLHQSLTYLKGIVDSLVPTELPTNQKSGICSICYASLSEYAALPCGHLSICEACLKKSREIEQKEPNCPICRDIVKSYQKIFVQ